MGLGKIETELEYFPGTMMPEKHIVTGWSSSQKATRYGSEFAVGSLLFVASTELSTIDISLINEMLNCQCDLVLEFPEGYLYRVDCVEITNKEAYFLDDFRNKLKWFDWRVFLK